MSARPQNQRDIADDFMILAWKPLYKKLLERALSQHANCAQLSTRGFRLGLTMRFQMTASTNCWGLHWFVSFRNAKGYHSTQTSTMLQSYSTLPRTSW